MKTEGEGAKGRGAGHAAPAPPFFCSCTDRKGKYPTMADVATGESQAGIWNPKLSASMIVPSTRMEYIALFLK